MKNHPFFRHVKHFFLLQAIFFAALLDVGSQERAPKSEANSIPSVSIPNTEMRTVYSKILNQDMILFIKLPASYLTNPQKVYPGLYLTDGNRVFPIVAGIASLFEIAPRTEPEILIVNIGYKIRDMADWAVWRTRDFTPTNVPSFDTNVAKFVSAASGRQFAVKSGGAAKFLEFIVKEAIPFVESNYRVSPTDRGLGGYSLGGLFSLYVLFKQPELFSIYYAGSPSIGFDEGVLFGYEKEYASSHKNLNAKLFMSAGGSEDTLIISNMNKMATLLRSRNYPGLTMETHVFPGETHRSCVPSSIMGALRVLYKIPPTTVYPGQNQ